MEITKQLLIYTKGLVEQKELLQQQLLQPISYAKLSSLRKEIIALNSKIQSTKAKMHNRVYAPINVVYYKAYIHGHYQYFKRVLPLTEREIHIMYQVSNDFSGFTDENPIKIIKIEPVNPSPIPLVGYEEKI